ncbi:hypothetical protein FM114_11530 [Luteococcus japonicus LSP_Lj1]|uniref:Uncharacterized protein n=1 Tax=Luteococcus japonicus LSP_Lj1 TaxID=1255658 RepID=A0A1R4K580_9ACTN|nr:hypothetical protein FM114_11530 [Luteococcus japonicus LSP_Lj1]
MPKLERGRVQGRVPGTLGGLRHIGHPLGKLLSHPRMPATSGRSWCHRLGARRALLAVVEGCEDGPPLVGVHVRVGQAQRLLERPPFAGGNHDVATLPPHVHIRVRALGAHQVGSVSDAGHGHVQVPPAGAGADASIGVRQGDAGRLEVVPTLGAVDVEHVNDGAGEHPEQGRVPELGQGLGRGHGLQRRPLDGGPLVRVQRDDHTPLIRPPLGGVGDARHRTPPTVSGWSSQAMIRAE